VLAESFRAHHADSAFFVLLVDGSPQEVSAGQGFEILTPADVGIDGDELARRATMYSTQGLVASMKPLLLLELLSRVPDPVVLLDADGLVCGDLGPVAALAEEHSLVLSPHSLQPHPLDGEDGPEQIILRAGVMNAGLLGVGVGARAFLRWWAERTARRCVFDEERGLMLAQTWLTLAVALFDHHVLRDPGCNVAGWNLQGRDVEWVEEKPTIEGGPLRHFHFAGSFDPEQPGRLTTIAAHERWWPALSERPGTARLADLYADWLTRQGHREASARIPDHARTPGGSRIEPWMRASYREALMDAEHGGGEDPPNPFSHGDARFLDWIERRTAERLAPETVRREGSSSARELTAALLDREQLLARIGELERIRDEAIAWAERASSELEPAREGVAAGDRGRAELVARLELRDNEVAEMRRTMADMRAGMDSVWRSPSWRMTRPLRVAKALIGRRGKEEKATPGL
jgi:hypothetical protein